MLLSPLSGACDHNSSSTESGAQWGSCPPGFEGECIYVAMPLDHQEPLGDEIDVMVARQRARGFSQAELWLLSGGPGNSAYHFFADGAFDALSDALEGVDIYTVEHRGVGTSTPLRCPDQQSDASPGGVEVVAEETAACAHAIDTELNGGLASMNTSNAARDLQKLLGLVGEERLQQFVYGVSYGTYLVQRFLQLFPEEVDGVILDSIASPQDTLDTYDRQADPVVMRMAGACAADSVCSGKLGLDPWIMIQETVAAVENGHCHEAGLTGKAVSSTLWGLIDHIDLREGLFPLIYRMARCDPKDIAAIRHMLAYVQELFDGTPPEFATLDNILLSGNIVRSEMVGATTTPESLRTTCEEATFCAGLAPFLTPLLQGWPSYEEPLAGRWAETSTPIVAFNGDLDVKTTIEDALTVARRFEGSNQNFYPFPNGPHGLIDNSPVRTPGAPTCAVQMIADFIDDPTTPPDPACLHDLRPFDPRGPSGHALLFFGTADMWENAATP